MGTKYTSQSTSGYNASPPSDDGTAVASNEVKWSFIKTKLADVLKTFGEGINTAILTHTDESILDKAVTYTTTAADHKRTINVTASATQSLGDAAAMATGYIVTIKNSHTAAITVDLATGTDTLDGTAAGSVSLAADASMVFETTSGADGYLIKSEHLPSTEYAAAYPAQVANHTRAGNRQLTNGGFSITAYDVDVNVADNVWESFGPTGSGADNIYDEMDVIPATATMVILLLDCSGYADTASYGTLEVQAVHGDVASPGDFYGNVIGFMRAGDAEATNAEAGTLSVFVEIPINSSGVFKMKYKGNLLSSGTENVNIIYKGFMTD